MFHLVKVSLMILFLLFCCLQSKNVRAESESLDLNSPACKTFSSFALGKIDRPGGFNTDGLVILKNGKNIFEFYDGDSNYGGSKETGLYTRDTPHALWSASKTITATLLARAIHEQVLVPKTHQPIQLQTKLEDFFPADESYGFKVPSTPYRGRLLPWHEDRRYASFYRSITMENLISMSSNFKWDESYESDIASSTFLPMLYLEEGNKNMLSYALRQPMMPEGPGKRWNYSGGNSIILMSVLRELYKNEKYSELPWSLLFDPLGMQNVIFERDEMGTFIGNSYVHMRPLDMAKFGQLFLDDGTYENKRLIDSTWVRDSLKVSPATLLPATPVDYIRSEGVYGARAFWVNQAVQGFGPEHPNSPKDMYFAGGHYGQLIIILPTQHIVIARTGHDAEYWSKIDEFVSKTLKCVN